MPNITDAVDLARLRTWTASGRARTIRESARLSRGDVARSIGVNETTVARWELGLRSPTGAAAVRYLELLNALRSELS